MRALENERGGINIGFIGLLTILFIVLKVTGYVAWSWWWVLAPLWIGIPVMIMLVLIIIFGAVLLDSL